MTDELKKLRDAIDKIDNELLDLISKRASLASNIGSLKTDGVIYRPEREAQVLRRLVEQNQGPLSNESIESIYKSIMSNCRALEKQISVAFLGPLGTFSEEASMKQFGESIVSMQTSSIDEVFHLVESHKAHYGVVPVENSTEGAINRTLDLLLTSNALICAEIILPVHHNLISNEKNLSSIKKIYSHAQSLSQCHQWLLNYAPGIELQSVSSNAEAAKIASKEKGTAAIASIRAAALFNTPVLNENIEDDPKNSTRFLVISNHEVKPSGLDKTSIIVAAKNQPGAIASMIEPFAKNKVSMTKLESRPSKTGLWEYVFFIDVEGHMTDTKVALSLKEIESKASFLKVLGSYPQSNLT